MGDNNGNIQKTLTLFLRICMLISIGGNIKMVKAALPPPEYEVNSSGGGVLVQYYGQEKNKIY